MVKQEINEYLAEHLFEYTKKDCKQQNDCSGGCSDEWCNYPQADYAENYQPVLELVVEKYNAIFKIIKYSDNYEFNIQGLACSCPTANCKCGHNFTGNGETLGEAICRAAVELLKSREGK